MLPVQTADAVANCVALKLVCVSPPVEAGGSFVPVCQPGVDLSPRKGVEHTSCCLCGALTPTEASKKKDDPGSLASPRPEYGEVH